MSMRPRSPATAGWWPRPSARWPSWPGPARGGRAGWPWASSGTVPARCPWPGPVPCPAGSPPCPPPRHGARPSCSPPAAPSSCSPGWRLCWRPGTCTPWSNWPRAPGSKPRPSVTDRLPDQDDVDPARQFLVDLEHLADVAVLPVGGLRAGVLELQAVLIDTLVGRIQVGDELLRADDEDDVGRAPGVGGELAAGRRSDDQGSVPGDRVHAAQGVVGLAADRLHLLRLGLEVEREHLVAR